MEQLPHFYFPTRLFIERDSSHKIGSFIKQTGDRILLLAVQHDIKNPDELAIIKTGIDRTSKGCILYDDITGKPGVSDIETVVSFARQSRCNVIVAFGSRDTFNVARLTALLTNNEILMQDMTAVNYPTKRPPLPIVNIPSSPSMGEEINPIISLYDRERNYYFQNTDPRLFPAMVYVDPKISEALTDSELASSGSATLAGSIEAILSRNANDITNSLAIRAIELVEKNLVTLINGTGGASQRTGVTLSSAICGMANSITGMGACYAIADALNHLTGIEFYTAIMIILPHIMEYNLTNAAAKYVQIARALEQDTHDLTVIEAAIRSVEAVRKITLLLKIPQRIAEFGIGKNLLRDVATLAERSQFIKNSPRDVNADEIEVILMSAY
jgi:alcohol dehydrogenase class IV